MIWIRNIVHIILSRYEKALVENGYDHVDFVGPDLLSRDDLVEMGVEDEKDLVHFAEEIAKNKSMTGAYSF